MKKTAIVVAGALAFDLGILVVGGQAGETPKGPQPQEAGAVDMFLKLDGPDKAQSANSIFIKLDKVNTPQACSQKLGKVVDTPQGRFCQLPKTPNAK